MWKHTSCGPLGTNCVSAESTVSVVKGLSNDDCSAPRVNLDYNGNMCNTQFTVCPAISNEPKETKLEDTQSRTSRPSSDLKDETK
jgi:hypothetical protein